MTGPTPAQRLWTVVVEALTTTVVEELATEICSRLFFSPAPSPRVSELALDGYLRGSVFAPFARRQVEQWAGRRLEEIGPQRARAVTLVAVGLAQSVGDASSEGVLRELVRQLR